MSGVGFAFNVDRIHRLAERIARLGKQDHSELLDDMGAVVASQTQRRIESEKEAPDGTPWPDWSEGYAATRHGGHSLLMGEGDLHDSIQHEVSPGGDSVEIGSNLIYAAAHQVGLDMSVMSSRARVTIPARPFLGLSGNNEAELEAIMDDFMDRQLEGI